MKHTRQVNALEARKWMVANPGKECLEDATHTTRWNPDLARFEWLSSFGQWTLNDCVAVAYTITEETTEQPKCEECERLREQRDRYKRWNLANEDACIRQAEEIAELQKQLEELKAEKRKGYEWKNCGKSKPPHCSVIMLRQEEEDCIGMEYFYSLGYKSAIGVFRIYCGQTTIPLPDPENWEYLELEGE